MAGIILLFTTWIGQDNKLGKIPGSICFRLSLQVLGLVDYQDI